MWSGSLQHGKISIAAVSTPTFKNIQHLLIYLNLITTSKMLAGRCKVNILFGTKATSQTQTNVTSICLSPILIRSSLGVENPGTGKSPQTRWEDRCWDKNQPWDALPQLKCLSSPHLTSNRTVATFRRLQKSPLVGDWGMLWINKWA